MDQFTQLSYADAVYANKGTDTRRYKFPVSTQHFIALAGNYGPDRASLYSE